MIMLAAVTLITLHMVDGRVVQVNPVEITQLIHNTIGHRVLVEKVKCVVRLTDGSFVSVAETCEEVQRAVQGGQP